MEKPHTTGEIDVDLLIIGAGPAGSSLAAFLANYGLENSTGLIISAAPGTADTPRAHLTNLSTLDAMRDLGVVDECYRLGRQGLHTKHYRWCETLAEEEYARIYSWGNDPARKGDYDAASPNPGLLDLPQSLLEPILVREATAQPGGAFKILFNTQLVRFEKLQDGRYRAVVKDCLRVIEYGIICRFLFGADGGRSVVATQLQLPGLPTERKAAEGAPAWNVLIRSDIGHLMQNREGNLHWNLRLKRDDGWMINTRMVKPWFEWLAVSLPKDPSQPGQQWTVEQWKDAWRDMVGDPTIPVEVLSTSKWNVNETCAERYSEDNVFCLGDAVHRHPPVNGLGSNTCVGDAFNLAWKVNLVLKGIASSSLLETYTLERQPVGADVVRMSNKHLRYHMVIWQIVGMQPPGKSFEERTAGLNILKEESARGREKRKALQEMCLKLDHETHALGLEMGQKYFSPGIYDADEPESWTAPGKEAEDPILYYEPCTYPGRRLPHAWIGDNPPTKLTSMLDLAGKGKFTIFTGIGGSKWKQAATEVGKELGIHIKSFSIGAGQDFEDIYWTWAKRRGVEEDGVVLVRPDLFCAWRYQGCFDCQEECTATKTEDADIYFLRWIFHNWSTKYSVNIIRNQIPVMRPGTKIIVNDFMLPEPNTLPRLLNIDMTMLGLLNATERDAEGWHDLFREANSRFKVTDIKMTPPGLMALITAEWQG
ncbi:2,4-dichlorophenol 6-monooxygenase [Lecanosticta acicola]|uniref:2,4-dichlorophenol 6-monooxygenase n=1 Tax=Lecanosticta acicola TaxID=111012 RepID=A0AAI8Z9B8_9PEZI|nr:2,4-dichlorophenol 6-monooxygenase [Lecanosticta acicola]